MEMETKYLLLSIAVATLGFLLWYALSTSLRLPKSFQIQYDVNGPYVRRIIRRRIAAFIIYGVIPIILIFSFSFLEVSKLSDLNINFNWNDNVMKWILILLPIIILFNWRGAGSRYNLTEYPEIRVSRWTPSMLIFNALSWLLYLVALEFVFRGMLLQSALLVTENEWAAIIIAAGIYSMIHYYKNNQLAGQAVPFSAILCYVTLDCDGSLLPAIFVHFVGGQITEILAISRHPEIKIET